MKQAAIHFALAAVQIPFILANPQGAYINWFACAFCSAVGLYSAFR